MAVQSVELRGELGATWRKLDPILALDQPTPEQAKEALVLLDQIADLQAEIAEQERLESTPVGMAAQL